MLPHLLDYISSKTRNRKLQNDIQKLTSIFKLINFLYFFYFLKNGKGSTFVEKIFNIETIYLNRPTLGIYIYNLGIKCIILDVINNSNLNRELIGHSFGHSIILFLPLIKFLLQKIKTQFVLKKFLAASDKILCDECHQIAILPIRCQNKQESFYCYYCFTLLFFDLKESNFLEFNQSIRS